MERDPSIHVVIDESALERMAELAAIDTTISHHLPYETMIQALVIRSLITHMKNMGLKPNFKLELTDE
jgi:hypothetical protein